MKFPLFAGALTAMTLASTASAQQPQGTGPAMLAVVGIGQAPEGAK